MKIETKHITLNKGVSEEKNVYTFIASTEVIDRDGDIISVEGWELDNFQKNPVILFAHNNSQMPVGKAVAVRKILGDEPRLEMDIVFADETEFGKDVKYLVDEGFLNAVSVGFRVLEYEEPDAETREKLGMGPWGIIITRQELLETSIVPVPANQTALRRAADKELIAEKTYDLLTKTDKGETEVTKAVFDRLDEIKAQLSLISDKVDSMEGTLVSPATPKDETIEDSKFYGELMDQVWDKLFDSDNGDN